MKKKSIISQFEIASKVYMIRGNKVMIDRDLAKLYSVETRALNQAVKRNIKRFPEDFMFSLTRNEILSLSQTVISSEIKYAPNVFAFTEQGVAMLSSILKSDKAVEINILIMRTFIKLRELAISNKDIKKRIDQLEKKYNRQFKVVFDAIKQLLEPPESPKPKKKFGFIG